MREPPQDPKNDVELARRARAGDGAAVDRLLERLRCVGAFLAHKNSRLGRPFDRSELEDVAQEVLIAVWEKLGTFEGRCRLEGWVMRFVHLEFIYRLRRKDHRPEELEDDTLLPGKPSDVSDFLERDRVYRTLDRIGGVEADMIRLKHLEELSFPEIAERLGDSVNTVKTRYYRGLQRARELLTSETIRAGEVAP